MSDTPPLRPGIPLHEQISSWLRDRIESGELPPEAQLPSEHDLCRSFGVSRVTARRALQTLEADGLIFRRQGLGTFVCERRMAQGLVRLTDFAQDMARAGVRAESRVLHREMEPCPAGVADRLALAPGAMVLRLDRLRLADGRPMALDRTWIPPFYAQFLEGHDLERETLYRILEREGGIAILSGRYRITADRADAESARHLGISTGDPLLVLERTSRTAGDRAVYFQRRLYRADRMAWELELASDPVHPHRPGEEAGMPLREFEAVVGAGDGTD